MPRYPIETFLAATAPQTCLLALDVSARRIGMAVTDPGRTMALPLMTLPRRKWADDLAAIVGTIQEKRVGGLVIGMPVNLDGSMGPAAQSCLTFASNLDKALAAAGKALPYVMIDESLTSHAARDQLAGRGRAYQAEDQIAAQMLLSDFLDTL